MAPARGNDVRENVVGVATGSKAKRFFEQRRATKENDDDS